MNWDLIHPACRGQFVALANDLALAYGQGLTKTLFLPFEGYRSPERQLELLKRGTTKAGPWRSAHQYGLAVDFVPKVNGRWTWDGEHDWSLLRAQARTRGLLNEIEWDRPHVESPLWGQVAEVLRPRISGSLP